MPPATRRRATRVTTAAVPKHITMEYRALSSLLPYKDNPRDNAAAISSVANSIKEFGFIVPIVANTDGVIAAGHTRYEAAKLLGYEQVPVIIADHLTEAQLRAFRVIDNKVSELSAWNFDLLSAEIQQIQRDGLTLQDFGYTNGELDCLNVMVAEDCLDEEGLVSPAEQARINGLSRRAPATARFVLGEVTFFIQASAYRTWIESVRTLHSFDEASIVAELKLRLGIVEEATVATERVRRQRVSS